MAESKAKKVEKWLLEEARYLPTVPLVLDGFCKALIEEGFAIRRATLALATLHPQFEVLRYIWKDEKSASEPMVNPFVFHHQTLEFDQSSCIETFLSYGCKSTAQLKKSPFWLLFDGTPFVFLDVNDKSNQDRYPLFNDLSALGATSYMAFRLNRDLDHTHMMSLVSDHSGGISESQTQLLKTLVPALSLCLELKLQELINSTLLDVYVGHTPGQKVLRGSIKPGDMEKVEAAIWYSDVRNFTGLSNQTEARSFVTWLNDYFACLVENVYRCDGEVLKFVGDALLAIFPVTDQADSNTACQNALSAAMSTNSQLTDWNAGRMKSGLPAMNHGIALHYGEVLYGNVGSLKRLDFTVIGPTINLAARIEGLCSKLEVPLLASGEFTGHCHDDFDDMGQFELKGFDRPIQVHQPRSGD